MLTTARLPIALGLLVCMLFSAPALAQQTNKPTPTTPADTSGYFSFLEVKPDDTIDYTRKREFEDYTLNQERYCIGCWCNNAYWEAINESFNDLVGKSEVFKDLWELISDCITPPLNSTPQIRTLPLLPKYDDLTYGKMTFYYSEFADKLLVAKIMVNDVKGSLEQLTKTYGDPEDIESTWYIWQRPGSLLLLDLFNMKKQKRETCWLYLFQADTLRQHLELVRTATKKQQ